MIYHLFTLKLFITSHLSFNLSIGYCMPCRFIQDKVKIMGYKGGLIWVDLLRNIKKHCYVKKLKIKNLYFDQLDFDQILLHHSE